MTAPWYFPDVSSWEPDANIPGILDKSNGVIGMRVGYGSKEDTSWRKWRTKTTKAQCVILYHFPVKSGRQYGMSVEDNAHWFVQHVGKLYPNEVPCLDVEDAGGAWSLADCKKWISIVHDSLGGPTPMVYANDGYVLEHGLDSLFTSGKGWIARYGSGGNQSPRPTHKWVAWQLSDGNDGRPRINWAGAGYCDTSRVEVTVKDFLSRVFAGAPTKVPPKPAVRELKKGSTGPDVIALKKALMAKGYKFKNGSNASFGPETERNVKAFQKAAKLAVDGVVGPNTRKALGL